MFVRETLDGGVPHRPGLGAEQDVLRSLHSRLHMGGSQVTRCRLNTMVERSDNGFRPAGDGP